jgi:hypothetical protein
VVEHLPSKYEILSSNPTTAKKVLAVQRMMQFTGSREIMMKKM